MGVLPILLGLLAIWVGVHGGSSWLPVGGAHLSVLVGVLESSHQSDELVGASSYGEVGHSLVSKDTFLINDVGGSEGNSCIWAILDQASVIFGNLVGLIREHWDLHWTKATLLSVLLGPLLMGEVRVDRASDDLGIKSIEL